MIEQSDGLTMLGVTRNDVKPAVYTVRLDPLRLLRAAHNEVFIRHHRYTNVALGDIISTSLLSA